MLIKTAEELQNYSSSEERKLEEIIKSIADTGVKVVVAGSSIGEMAMHFIEKYKMMAIRSDASHMLARSCTSLFTCGS